MKILLYFTAFMVGIGAGYGVILFIERIIQAFKKSKPRCQIHIETFLADDEEDPRRTFQYNLNNSCPTIDDAISDLELVLEDLTAYRNENK